MKRNSPNSLGGKNSWLRAGLGGIVFTGSLALGGCTVGNNSADTVPDTPETLNGNISKFAESLATAIIDQSDSQRGDQQAQFVSTIDGTSVVTITRDRFTVSSNAYDEYFVEASFKRSQTQALESTFDPAQVTYISINKDVRHTGEPTPTVRGLEYSFDLTREGGDWRIVTKDGKDVQMFSTELNVGHLGIQPLTEGGVRDTFTAAQGVFDDMRGA